MWQFISLYMHATRPAHPAPAPHQRAGDGSPAGAAGPHVIAHRARARHCQRHLSGSEEWRHSPASVTIVRWASKRAAFEFIDRMPTATCLPHSSQRTWRAASVLSAPRTATSIRQPARDVSQATARNRENESAGKELGRRQQARGYHLSHTRQRSTHTSPALSLPIGMRPPPYTCPSSPALASPCISAVSAASRRTAAAPVGSRMGGLRAALLARPSTLSAVQPQQGAAGQQKVM